VFIYREEETKNPPNWRMILRSGRDSNPTVTLLITNLLKNTLVHHVY